MKPAVLEDRSDVPKAHGYQGQPRGWVTMMGQLQTGMSHLPLYGLSHELLQLPTFSTPWKELRVESRSKALCALEKLAGQVFR